MKNKEELQKQVEVLKKELQVLEDKLNTPSQTAREWLQEKWNVAIENNGLSYDNCRTYYNSPHKKGDEWLFQQDWENKKLYYSYYHIHLILNSRYGTESVEIDKLVMEVVGKDVNCNGLTPITCN